MTTPSTQANPAATEVTPAESAAELVTEFDAPTFGGANADSSIAVATFDQAYKARPPWDINGPQPAFARLLDAGLITGRVLDVGCGTGENALHYASRGLDVTALDASAVAIARAQQKAQGRVLSVRFIHGNALALPELGETFDTVTDSGLLHVLSDAQTTQLIRGVRAVLRPAGRYWLMCFSEHSTGSGPRKLTKARISELFEHGWKLRSIEATHFQTVAGRGYDTSTTAAWLAQLERL